MKVLMRKNRGYRAPYTFILAVWRNFDTFYFQIICAKKEEIC